MKHTLKLISFCLFIYLIAAANYLQPRELKDIQKKNETDAKNYTITVHLVPHSHDDIGWLKTVDQYYYGDQNRIQQAEVQYILDSVTDELSKDPSKRFVYVEIGFFYRWWNQQNEQKKQQFRKLLENGQLEFLNGGWCMQDEANPYYEDMIDQMTLGHEFLKKEFNIVPKVSWHIDPFGHSAANAAMFNQMGFDSLFFARVDIQDFIKRMEDATMELVWNPRQDSKQDHSLFCHVNYFHYSSPEGYNFDVLGNDSPVMDDPTLEGYNIDKKAEDLVSYFKQMSVHYPHKTELLHTLGDDFQYSNAHRNFKNYDKLIKYINERPEYGVRLQYSTPSEYIKKINSMNITFDEKTDDFFPYSDTFSGYWTGYFTSRPNLKYMIKFVGRYLQSIRSLFGLLSLENDSHYTQHANQIKYAINQLEQAIAVGQHHDAVAGTERQLVAEDYAYQIDNALQLVRDVYAKYLRVKNRKDLNETIDSYEQCNWNLTSFECNNTYNALKNGKPILLNVFNPDQDKTEYIRTKVPNVGVDIFDAQNNKLNQSQYDVICSNITNAQDCDLFVVTFLKGHALTYLKVVPNQSIKTVQSQQLQVGNSYQIDSNQKLVFKSNNDIELSRCQKASDTKDHTSVKSCDNFKFNIKYNYYKSYQRDLCNSIECIIKRRLFLIKQEEDIGQLSGAYIFRPTNDTINGSITYVDQKRHYNTGKVFKGNSVTVFAFYDKKITQHLRVYHNTEALLNKVIESETFVNSIDISDEQGREVVMNIQTDINNGKYFYTDSNGLELQQRILNYRATWNYTNDQPVSGNYYPINAMIGINDDQKSLFVLNDRSQGGSSYINGNIEIMIHRRLTQDDSRGVAEALDERNSYNNQGMVSKMKHYLVFESQGDFSLPRKVQLNNDFYPIVEIAQSQSQTFTHNNSTLSRLSDKFQQLPDFVKVYVSDKGNNQFLVRFHNMNPNESRNVTLNHKFEELTMSANQNKCQMMNAKLSWNNGHTATCSQQNGQNIVLLPLEMRTFMIEASGVMYLEQ